MEKTVCELFAGVGGFRLGLEASTKDTEYTPWHTVYANQWEPSRKRQDAFTCYCHHFGSSPSYTNVDIALVDKQTIPDHMLLVGGFPCQDYSVARTNAKGIEGKKGVLRWQILATIQAKHPPFVLLENVDRLLKSPAKQRGRDFGIILASFWQEGYYISWRVINAADYGFVQRRRRTFIFASPFETAGIMKEGVFCTAKALPAYQGAYASLRDILDHDVPEAFYLPQGSLEKWQYVKGAKRMERVAKNGHPYTYSEGAIPFPDAIDKEARTILTSESSLNRSTHVIADPKTGRLRLLTPSEVEAVQGFPKGWTDTGMSPRFRYFCMGNALVTGIVCRIGRELNRIVSLPSL